MTKMVQLSDWTVFNNVVSVGFHCYQGSIYITKGSYVNLLKTTY